MKDLREKLYELIQGNCVIDASTWDAIDHIFERFVVVDKEKSKVIETKGECPDMVIFNNICEHTEPGSKCNDCGKKYKRIIVESE